MKQDYLPMNTDESIQNLGPKPETVSVLDKLIGENIELRRNLQLKTQQLRVLQNAVDDYLMGSASESLKTLNQINVKEML